MDHDLEQGEKSASSARHSQSHASERFMMVMFDEVMVMVVVDEW